MPETAPIRAKTRRAKDLALNKAIHILEHPDKYDKSIYDSTYLTILKNTVPRTQEITGEEGTPITMTFDSSFNPSATLRQTTTDKPEQSEIQDSQSGS